MMASESPPSSTSFALGPIGQIALRVRDMPRAVAFYRDVLGVRHLFDAGPSLSFFDCGGIRLMLSPAEKPEFDHPGSVLYYRVSDIGAAYEALVGRGARFIDAPHRIAKLPDYDLWMTFLHDSEDNVLALMSEVRH
ncbi:MAG: VOC family protein [Gemmatimonadaceae bacterium]